MEETINFEIKSKNPELWSIRMSLLGLRVWKNTTAGH
jgi:hypothetical protein